MAAQLLFAGCAPFSPSQQQSAVQQQIASVLGWPLDVKQGSWVIENGYNTDPDHHNYELYSFDFQLEGDTAAKGLTTGQSILSPVTGDVVDIGSAYPGDFSSGRCARISVDGYPDYYVMVCHLTAVVKSRHVSRGADVLGAVSGGKNGNHIHMTLYKLKDHGTPDTAGNATNRQEIPFTDSWNISGCQYPPNADGSRNQWAGTAIPCANPNATITPSTPTPIPTPTVVVTCAQISGFQNKRDAASLVEPDFRAGYGYFSGVILPAHAVGYQIGTSDIALHDQRDTQFHFQRIAVCVDGATSDAIRTFYANGMPENGWTQSAVYPYKGQLQAACGDPYCWEDIIGGGNIFWLSLEDVQQRGSATTFQLRMGYETLLEIFGPLKRGTVTPTRTHMTRDLYR